MHKINNKTTQKQLTHKSKNKQNYNKTTQEEEEEEEEQQQQQERQQQEQEEQEEEEQEEDLPEKHRTKRTRKFEWYYNGSRQGEGKEEVSIFQQAQCQLRLFASKKLRRRIGFPKRK